jgi:biopolymer transport protein ExbD
MTNPCHLRPAGLSEAGRDNTGDRHGLRRVLRIPRAQLGENITPLIDVVLVLLIIFMVMTPTTMKHLKPQMARESAELTPGPQPVTVEMTASGYTVNGEKTEAVRVFDLCRGAGAQVLALPPGAHG